MSIISKLSLLITTRKFWKKYARCLSASCSNSNNSLNNSISSQDTQSGNPELANIPKHVAIIMDGNGRWALSRGLPRGEGHQQGAESIRHVMEVVREYGIKYLTIYAFSAENWQRSNIEVQKLMDLLRHYLQHELPSLRNNGVALRIIGDISLLPEDIQQSIAKAEQENIAKPDHYLTIALSYGSRQEIVSACKSLAFQVATGITSPETITEELYSNYLYTAGLPDPDLLIRTGGEKRLSNFLLWQCAYTELYFCDTLWPDFGKEDFIRALKEYSQRERRFGK